MGKSAPPSNNSYKGIAELYYVETDVATFRLHSSRGQTNTDARNAHAGDRHPFPYGGRAVIRIIMVVCVKLVGQALPRAWAVGTARKMAYTVRLTCCWGVGAGLVAAAVVLVPACFCGDDLED